MTKKGSSFHSKAFLCLAIALCLLGCKKKEQVAAPPPPSPRPAAVQPAPKPVQAQPSSAKPAAGAVPQFDFSKIKDPFKPFIVEQPKLAATNPGTAPIRKSADALPIESFELSRFKVAGIIVGMTQNSALVIDPAGKGYVVKPGMTIGSNSGRITKITASAIEVEERYTQDNGRHKQRTVRLTLPQKK